jgi:hypothetical protein
MERKPKKSTAKKTSAKKSDTKKKMGRPLKELDKKDFESLLAIQCTLSEVTAFFDNKLDGCSEDTVERWCKRTYNKTFAEVSAKKREVGKISIRRAQFEMMKRNPTALIWVSKQYLGQTDKQEISVAEVNPTIVDEIEKEIGRFEVKEGDEPKNADAETGN